MDAPRPSEEKPPLRRYAALGFCFRFFSRFFLSRYMVGSASRWSRARKRTCCARVVLVVPLHEFCPLFSRGESNFSPLSFVFLLSVPRLCSGKTTNNVGLGVGGGDRERGVEPF